MPVRGTCSRCGDCCSTLDCVTREMWDKYRNHCKYAYFDDDKIAYCRFREGLDYPEKHYQWYLKHCVPYPANELDFKSIPNCTYYWEYSEEDDS